MLIIDKFLNLTNISSKADQEKNTLISVLGYNKGKVRHSYN